MMHCILRGTNTFVNAVYDSICKEKYFRHPLYITYDDAIKYWHDDNEPPARVLLDTISGAETSMSFTGALIQVSCIHYYKKLTRIGTENFKYMKLTRLRGRTFVNT